MVEPAYAPRLSASVGAAIRRARTGRFSLAELARRSGTSVGALSLIERGRGNPSFETLVRIADALGVSIASLVATPDERAALPRTGTNARGGRPRPAVDVTSPAPGSPGRLLLTPAARDAAIARLSPADDALDLSAADAADSPVTVLPRSRAAAWRDSMLLHQGQEAVVAVRTGAVEITMVDRSDEFVGDIAQPLSLDINVRGVPTVAELTLPPVSDPRWERLVAGETDFRPTVLACQILFTHVTRSVRDDPTPANVYRWVADLRAALLKYEELTEGEVARLFG